MLVKISIEFVVKNVRKVKMYNVTSHSTFNNEPSIIITVLNTDNNNPYKDTLCDIIMWQLAVTKSDHLFFV